MMKFIFKSVFLFFITILLSSLILLEGDSGHFTSIRGKKQYVVIAGDGNPTIVFLTGKGRLQNDFKKVYDKLAASNQIFSYDRSGIGQSELIRNDRTIDTMAFELNLLLKKERLKPPFILVGHSLGSSVARCYAEMYPSNVSAMLFLDPAHEEEYRYGLSIRNDSDKVVFADQFKDFLKIKGKTKGIHAESKQCFDFDSAGYSTNQKILKALKTTANIPVTIILSTEADIDNDYIDQEMKYRDEYFAKWKLTNPAVKIIQAPKTGYFIQKEEPKLVIDEINDLISGLK